MPKAFISKFCLSFLNHTYPSSSVNWQKLYKFCMCQWLLVHSKIISFSIVNVVIGVLGPCRNVRYLEQIGPNCTQKTGTPPCRTNLRPQYCTISCSKGATVSLNYRYQTRKRSLNHTVKVQIFPYQKHFVIVNLVSEYLHDKKKIIC